MTKRFKFTIPYLFFLVLIEFLFSIQYSFAQCNFTNTGTAAVVSCYAQSLYLGDGESRNLSVVSGHKYIFSYTNNASSNGMCINGAQVTANPYTYTASSTANISIGIFRSNASWSGSSAILNYRKENISISQHPVSTTRSAVKNSTPAPYTITASSESGGSTINYQWYVNTTASNSGGTAISGANSNNYTPSTSTEGTTYYYCIVTLANGCSAISNVSGPFIVYSVAANALSFDGTNDFVNLGSTTNFPNTSAFTIEAWVNRDAAAGGMVVSKYNGSIVGQFQLYVNSNGTVSFIREVNPWSIVSTITIPEGKWSHIAATYNGTTMNLYINGQLAGSLVSGSVGTTAASTNVLIGASYYSNSPNNFFKGKIDEVRIWSLARSQSEVLANMYNEISPTTSGLLRYYKFNITSGGALLDAVSTPVDGVLANFAMSGTTSNWVESYAMVVPSALSTGNITANSFTANWSAPTLGAVGNYILDVSRSPNFTNFLTGYNNKNVGTATSVLISGLENNTLYYWRVRAEKASVTNQGAYTAVQQTQTLANSGAVPGNGLIFDGLNDYVSTNNLTTNPTSFTLEAWFNTTVAKGGIVGFNSGNNITGSGNYDRFIWMSSDGKINFGIYNGVAYVLTSTNAFNDGKYHHVAATFSTAVGMKLYLDGILVGSNALNSVSPYNGYWLIGGMKSWGNTNGDFFQGTIDEVKIWNTVRTQAEIQAGMYNEINPSGLSSSLTNYYRFNASSGTILNDFSTNDRDATLIRFALSGTTSNWVESYAMIVPPSLNNSLINSSGFTANWTAPVAGSVENYLLDVSTSPIFATFVAGYNSKNVGNVLSSTVTGLNPFTTYYWRVRANKSSVYGTGGFKTQTVQTSKEPINVTSTTQSSTYNLLSNSPKVVDPNVQVAYSQNIDGFRVIITGGKEDGDLLAYTGVLPSGVTAATYNPSTGVLAFSGSTSSANWQALLRTVTFKAFRKGSSVRTISFSAGLLNSFSNGHFYELIATTGTWSSAKDAASARSYLNYSGYLATVTSQAENDYIKQILNADAWMGASDDYAQINTALSSTLYANQTASEGKWYWVTGPEAGTQITSSNYPVTVIPGRYNNWYTNEPNNAGSAEHYAQFYSTFSGKWNDLPNSSQLGYLVEYGGLSTDILQSPSYSITLNITSPEPGNALHFDGSNDFVSIPDNNSLDLTNSYTLEAWIKPTSFSALAGIISKYHTSSANGYMLRLSGTSPYTGIQFDEMTTANGILTADKWYHIAAVKNGTVRKLYVNGQEFSLSGTGLSVTVNSDSLKLGSDFNGRFFNGAIDEVRIWSSAKTQAEVQANMFAPVSVNAANLVAYFNFNQGNANDNNTGINAVYDQTASANNGKLNGFALTGTSSNWTESYAMVAPVISSPTKKYSLGFTANWTPPVTGIAEKYFLDLSTDRTFNSFVPNYNNTEVGNVNSAVINGLAASTKYYLRLRAEKTGLGVSGSGVNSNIDSITTNVTETLVAKGASDRTSVSFTANWSAPPIHNISSYLLDVSTNNTFTAPISGSPFLVTDTFKNVTGLTPNTTYFYRIRVNRYNNSNTITTNTNAPFAAIAISSNAVCKNGTSPIVTFTGSGSRAPYTFIYQLNDGGNQTITTIGQNESVTLNVPTNNVGQLKYTLISVTDADNGSNIQSGSVLANINEIPVPTFILNAPLNICSGVQTTYSTQESQTNYQWTISGVQGIDYSIESGAVINTSPTVSLKWLTNGNKSVSVNYTSLNGCKASNPVISNTSVSLTPVVASISGSNSITVGLTTSLLNATLGGTWSSSDLGIAYVDSNGIVTGISTGNTTISYSKSLSGCSSSASFAFSVLDAPVPTITSLSSSTGIVGTYINIYGTNFKGTSQVMIGNYLASFTVISPTNISVRIPDGTGSNLSVSVTTPGGIVTQANLFTYVTQSAPTITSFTPSTAGNGMIVSINGTNFTTATDVSFGGAIASGYTIVSDVLINAIVDTGSTGSISVTNPAGVATKTGFTYVPAPTITSFTPTSALAGSTITITGTNLTNATAVTFGGVAATSFVKVSSTVITAIVSSGGATGSVGITTPGGTASTLSDFTYIPPAPTITSFTPTSAGAGATVVIKGTGFFNISSITIGGTEVTSFTIDSSTQIKAIVASGTTGKIVINNTSGSVTSTADFTFIQPPTISSFTPSSSVTGLIVTITGTNLTGTSSVKFGGTNATSFTVLSSTQITATVGAGTTGDVFVTTLGGTATKSGFTYIGPPAILSFTPLATGSGNTVTITGLNLSGATAVSFGGTPAASFTVISSTIITAVVGSGTDGNVSVTTPGGTATLTGFSLVPAPTIISFSPTSTIKGSVVNIIGTNLNNASAVSFGGTAAASYTIVSPNLITAIVGNGSTGNISITTPGGSVSKNGFKCRSIWVGNHNSDWNNPLNWLPQILPDSVATVSTELNQPIISSGTVSYNDVIINNGSHVKINGSGELKVTGKIINNGVLDVTDGTVSLEGSDSSISITSGTFKSNSVKNLKINKPGKFVSLADTLKVTGTISPTAGSLKTNGVLILKSTVDADASIAEGNSAGGYIEGNVKVERYLGNTRSWRMVGFPFSRDSVIKGSVLKNYYAGDYLAYSYSEALDNGNYGSSGPSNAGWVYLSGTKTITADKGLLLVGGSSSLINITSKVNTGTQIIPLAYSVNKASNRGWNLIANPFPANLDWDKVVAANPSVNLANAIYRWDPTNQVYATYVNGFSTGNQSNIIENGASFFVQSFGAQTFTITESCKSVESPSGRLFSAPTQGSIRSLSIPADQSIIKLYLLKAGDSTVDETILRWGAAADATDSLDFKFDALDMGRAAGPDLSVSDNNKNLYAIFHGTELKNPSDEYRIIQLNTANLELGSSYVLKMEILSSLAKNNQAYIYDQFSKEYIKIDLTAKDYRFKTNVDSLSIDPKRFSVVFNKQTATINAETIISEDEGLKLMENPIRSNEINLLSQGNYQQIQWQLTDNSGKVLGTGSLSGLIKGNRFKLTPAQSLSPGMYVLRINNSGKLLCTYKILKAN